MAKTVEMINVLKRLLRSKRILLKGANLVKQIIYLGIDCDMDAINTVEVPGFLLAKNVKKFSFATEGITIESGSTKTFIAAENINAFRFRVVWFYGFYIPFGRQYIIETKDFNNKISQIKFTSIYGIRRKAYYKAWYDIFSQLWHHYFSNMFNYYVDMYNIRQAFELAGVKFDVDGISWDKKNKLLWNEIALKSYRSYFMIHHINDLRQHKSCNFGSDWNAYILQYLLKGIINQQKKIQKV